MNTSYNPVQPSAPLPLSDIVSDNYSIPHAVITEKSQLIYNTTTIPAENIHQYHDIRNHISQQDKLKSQIIESNPIYNKHDGDKIVREDQKAVKQSLNPGIMKQKEVEYKLKLSHYVDPIDNCNLGAEDPIPIAYPDNTNHHVNNDQVLMQKSGTVANQHKSYEIPEYKSIYEIGNTGEMSYKIQEYKSIYD